MIKNTVLIGINMFVALSFVLTYNAIFIQKKKNMIQNYNIAYVPMALGLLVGYMAFDWPFKTLLLLLIMGFAISQILFIKRHVQHGFALFVQTLIYVGIFWIPYEKIPLPDGFFLDLNGLLFLVDSLIIMALYQQVRHTDFKNKLTSPIALMGLSTIIVFLVPADYSLLVMTLLCLSTGNYHIKMIIEDNLVHEKELEMKVKRLEKEFNEEVRKAVNRHTFHLKEVQERMSHINKIDNLTKAYNKKAIFNIIDDLTQDRRVPIFSVIMFDIDHFKTLNDTLGHVQGDLCLKTLSTIAFDSIRETDYLGRYGGDEFMIVLPKADLKTARTIAERFREKVDKNTQPHFTLSIGLATFPDDGDNLKPLLDIADKGLYLSKEKGRNSVSYYNPNKSIRF